MKSTETFKNTIQNHLNEVASRDESFAAKLKNEKKNIDDCITYILNQVQKSGCNGFADEEIFGMALHYYDEEKVDVGKKVNASVVVNHTVELTAEEIEKARSEAKEKVVNEEMERLRNKPKKSKAEAEINTELSLFDNV